MNRRLVTPLLLALACCMQPVLAQSAPVPRLAPLAEQAQAATLSAAVLSRYHYKATPLDDALSVKIFDRYFKTLDPEHIFFTQADIDRFAGARTLLDDALIQGRLNVAFDIFQLYQQRIAERMRDAKGLLAQGFDFTVAETYEYARDKAPWPKDDAEMHELWRKRVKYDWLRLRLGGKDDAAIVAMLDKRYENNRARTERSKSEDVFQIFMNAYATSIEPHTNYLGPSAADSFDISMRLSLVGIGAVLQEREEYVTIRELVAGGPAARSERLAVGDRIVGVGQGDNGALVDVVGTRVDDVVKLIRGEKDTKVVLDVLPADAPDGTHKRVVIVRDKIKLDDQAAKKSIINVGEGSTARKVGVINLPTFYDDFEGRRKGDKDYRSTSRDVARLIEELKKEKVDGLLIDLRNNGGGSLREAVDLTGLFIDKGPVVLQRRSDGKIDAQSDDTPGVAWDGAMAVLINRGSASASEIFAAALQDYGRAPIIGDTSFGKGTVQTIVDLNDVARKKQPAYGELKMTIAQFFRVNGGTTQLKGVIPDIRLPSVLEEDDGGEASFDNALPWTRIDPADFAPAGDLRGLLPALQSRHDARVANDREYGYLLEDVAEAKRLRDSKSVSLNEAERRKDKEAREARLKARANQDGADKLNALKDDGLQSGERSLAAELATEKALKERKDVLLQEAARIVDDEAQLLAATKRVASREGKRTQ